MAADETRPKRSRRARKHRLVIKGIPDALHETFKAMALKRRMPMTRLALEIISRHVATQAEADEIVDVVPERPIRPEPMF
ncbi:MAG: hypothetical protein K2P80_01350 [Beijerinckiaceae bacterium]|nr:hypothetical protein [Beijerinckiaceae bacterium]